MKKRKNYILLLLLLCQTVVWAQGTDRVAAIREKLFTLIVRMCWLSLIGETGEMPVKILLRQ